MSVRFNAPPGWDVPSNPQWTPPQEWKPQPWWPPAPEGWVFWVPVDETPAVAAAPANPVHVNQAAPPAPAEPQSFWSLRMSRDSVIAFGMVLVVLLGLFVWTRWSAGGDEREQRRVEQFTDAGTDVCLKAVRNLFTLPSRVEIPTSTRAFPTTVWASQSRDGPTALRVVRVPSSARLLATTRSPGQRRARRWARAELQERGLRSGAPPQGAPACPDAPRTTSTPSPCNSTTDPPDRPLTG